MTNDVYRYQFQPEVPLEEIESSLLLAAWGTESLHGESQTRLDAAHFLDPLQRVCVVNADTPVGRDFNRLFVGFLRREFGDESFQVERVESGETAAVEAD